MRDDEILGILARRAVARGELCLRASGGCMAPLLEDGDTLVVDPLPEPIPRGSIVLIAAERGEFHCHRFLGNTPRGTAFVAGDRSGRAEVEVHQLLGVVVAARRGTKTIRFDGPAARLADSLIVLGRRIAPRLPKSLQGLVSPIHRWVLRARGLAWTFGRTS